MTVAEEVRQFEILDHNVAAGYVTYIVDIWDGDKDDPTVAVNRYIGVWRGEQLEKEDGEAFDPDFTKEFYGGSSYRRRYAGDDQPVVWESLEEIKKADREAVSFKRQQEQALGGTWGTARIQSELYQAFLNAVEVLADDYENQEAWAAVDAYRQYQAQLNEK